MKNNKKKIVVATEDSIVQDLVNKILKQYDYAVIYERSTTASIVKILEQEIASIILDLEIPQNSNFDLLKIIKKVRPRLPIIALTDDYSLETVRKITEIGVFYCAAKPLQVGEIEKVLNALERFLQKNDKS